MLKFTLHYLDGCTCKLLVILGAIIVLLFVCIIIAMKCFNEVVKCQLDKNCPSHKACSLGGLVLVQADPLHFFIFFYFYFFPHADSM